MLTIFIIIVSLASFWFVFYVLFGKQAKELPDEHIIWQKPVLDDHEKSISE